MSEPNVTDEARAAARRAILRQPCSPSDLNWKDIADLAADAAVSEYRRDQQARIEAMILNWEQRYGDDSIGQEIADLRALAGEVNPE